MSLRSTAHTELPTAMAIWKPTLEREMGPNATVSSRHRAHAGRIRLKGHRVVVSPQTSAEEDGQGAGEQEKTYCQVSPCSLTQKIILFHAFFFFFGCKLAQYNTKVLPYHTGHRTHSSSSFSSSGIQRCSGW